MGNGHWANSLARGIRERLVLEGDLILQTLAHLGNGDGDDLTDMPLLMDPQDGQTPLLTGASIAGALRSYLRSRQYGDRHPQPKEKEIECENSESHAAQLFGGLRGYEEGEQSPLIVDDSLGKATGVELRDGVKLNPATRTAGDKTKFDLQLWPAGTRFPLRFELLLTGKNDEQLKPALATALTGLNDGSITLGARKRRGFGKVKVAQWRLTTYDLTTPDGLLAWVAAERNDLHVTSPQIQESADLAKLLKVTLLEDRRRCCWLKATFALDGSLLIRSGSGQDDLGPDMVHLHTRQPDGSRQPILSGTSLAGALRARALRIAQTLGGEKGKALVDEVFGPDLNQPGVKPKASKISVEETVVRQPLPNLVQNRVSIDRFTGGAFETALFNQQAVWGQGDTTVTACLRLVNPADEEMGLLLLLLKDLWTRDLPVGGESSVGRGRLRGRQATLQLMEPDRQEVWLLLGDDERVIVDRGDRAQLEGYVTKLNQALGP